MAEKIKFDTHNYRNHDEQNLKLIDKSLKECGAGRSILLDSENEIIAGNATYKNAIANNIPVKIIETDGKTLIALKRTDLKTNSKKRKKLALLDNSTSNKVLWDLDNISADFDLSELPELGLEDLPAASIEDTEITEDEVPNAEDVETKCKKGDIWQLGEHRLMCGDSTDEDDVKKLMNGNLAHLLLTDPPYNVNVQNSQGMKIENDNMPESDFLQLLQSTFAAAAKVLEPNAAFYVWHGDSGRVQFQKALEDNGFKVKECLIWVKNGFTLGRQDYQWAHEPCLYGWREGQAHYFIDERNHATVFEDKIDLKKLKKEELLALAERLLSPETPTTVLHADKPVKNDLHPTMKPNKLISQQVRNSTKVGGNVLDLFGGSGTTLICAEQLHRNCFMMEYDPRYCDVIIQRWENLTGKEAKLCK